MIEQAFEVATEFRFDVGQAIVNTDALKGAVDDLSKSAGSALGSLDYLASGMVARLGLGSGGLLSLLSKAVQISEAFRDSSLSFANNISSNMQVLTGTIDTFNDRLGTSEMLMGNIQKEAIKFGLDTTQLAHMTSLLATPLANRGKLGTNYEGGIHMARNLSLASEAVGLNPGLSAEMLSRAITDHMAIHGALFARLANTVAFKQAHVFTQPQLMNMNTDRKIDLLNKALEQLAGDSEWIASRIQSITTQLTIFKDQLEIFLKPIGDALVKPIGMLMQTINTYMAKYGKQLGETVGRILGDALADPKRLLINLMQIRSLGADLRRAFDVASLIQISFFLSGIAPKVISFARSLGIFNGAILQFLEGMWVQIVFFAKKLISLEFIGTAMRFIGAAIAEFGLYLLGFLALFQVISRARAIAHIQDLTAMAETLPKFSSAMLRIKNALVAIETPFELFFDKLANMIAPIFRSSTWLNVLTWGLEKFASVLEFVANIVTKVAAVIYSAFNVVSNLHGGNGMQGMLHPFESFSKDYKSFIDQNALRLGKPGESTSQHVVNNNNHIEARFDMREQMEPDRIAFAVTEHLKRLAINPSQGSGRSANSAFGRPNFAGAQ